MTRSLVVLLGCPIFTEKLALKLFKCAPDIRACAHQKTYFDCEITVGYKFISILSGESKTLNCQHRVSECGEK